MHDVRAHGQNDTDRGYLLRASVEANTKEGEGGRKAAGPDRSRRVR